MTRPRSVPHVVAAAAAFALGASLFAASPAQAASKPKPTLSSITAASRDIAPGTEVCFSGKHQGNTKVMTCSWGRKGPRLLLIGDSHMRALSPAFRRLAAQGKIRITLIARARCSWSTRVIVNDTKWIRDECQQWRANVAKYIKRQKNVRAIVTTHRAATMAGKPAQRGHDALKAWRTALDRKIPVIAFTSGGNWISKRPTPIECLRKNTKRWQWKNCADRSSNVLFFDWSKKTTRLARAKYGKKAAFRIRMRTVYCPDGLCTVVAPNGQIKYRDHHHITAAWARMLAPVVERRLRKTGVVFRS